MSVPKYLLYGQGSEGPVDWFLNIEQLSKRCQERGWKIGLHSHPAFAQVMFVLRGRGVMQVGEKALNFNSPCALIIPVDAIHGFDYQLSTDGWVVTLAEYCLAQISSRVAQISQLMSLPAVIPLARTELTLDVINSRLGNIQKEILNQSENYEIIVESELLSLLISLQRVSRSSNQAGSQASDKQLKLVYAFKALIEEHLFENLKIPEYAERLHVTSFQLRSACESVCQCAPKEVLEERKLMEAKKDLIFSTRTIEQIAYRLGFTDPSYFTRFFRKREGEAPSNFREQFKVSH
ncbi:AraC family transcriptional regulator [Halioxenophilus sp. WMMB6]|uniref:AraC family transcriptional regulator n=1 Tax=Halioxenophilus sp. WMMB6 TaxID=3073815 RepID=UPI00295EA103|nr:AraC family transcriptional regulator [Halioxenophilus sp. WMMB6]